MQLLVQPEATVPVDLPCFGLCQSRNKTCPLGREIHYSNFRVISFLCKLQSIACGSIHRSMFSGVSLSILRYHYQDYYQKSLLPLIIPAPPQTIAKSSPAPPLNQSRHALPCEARLRSPENHSVL
ncbi:hypothetical protein EAE99_004753 [Botrytis elliptica]|nr:hypothetical protein EAE99_004753 [Botrytis elliptica]